MFFVVFRVSNHYIRSADLVELQPDVLLSFFFKLIEVWFRILSFFPLRVKASRALFSPRFSFLVFSFLDEERNALHRIMLKEGCLQ